MPSLPACEDMKSETWSTRCYEGPNESQLASSKLPQSRSKRALDSWVAYWRCSKKICQRSEQEALATKGFGLSCPSILAEKTRTKQTKTIALLSRVSARSKNRRMVEVRKRQPTPRIGKKKITGPSKANAIADGD